MKKRAAILVVVIILFPFFGFSQIIKNIDYISPFNEGLSAIKKGNQWAFIDSQGTIVINFRDDLVLSDIDNKSYPVFKNNRCLIKQKKEGILYFGYIDRSGNTVIKPQFLNATNFMNNTAIVLELVVEKLGKNNLLAKDVINNKYHEVIIDTNGNPIHYLSDFIYISLSKKFIKKPPYIKSRRISDNLIAVRHKNKKWEVRKIE